MTSILGPDQYGLWNHGLVDVVFPERSDDDDLQPVSSIPAAPSVLHRVRAKWGDPEEGALDDFKNSLRHEFESRREHTHQLLDAMHQQVETWSPQSDLRPPFFAFLWSLCLVARGFPENVGTFRERLELTIAPTVEFGTYSYEEGEERDVNFYWDALATWLRLHRGYDLWLPPVTWKRHVGRAYALVFPDAFDRRALADALRERGLLGIDPPVKPVVDAIETELQTSNAFSDAFRQAFQEFARDYDRGRIDPSEHPIWLSIQREIQNPSPDRDRGRTLTDTTLVGWLDEGPISLAIASNEPVELEDDELTFHEVDYPLGGYGYFLESTAGEEPVGQLLDGRLPRVGSVHNLATQGLLFFTEVGPSEFAVTSGSGISEAPLALVREDRLSAFIDQFGGTVGHPVRDRWHEVWQFTARYLDDLPVSLEGVTQLIKPTVPRSIGLSGGVRVSRATYLALPHLLPVARADWAESVECRWGRDSVLCNELGDGAWALPSEMVGDAPVDATLVGRDEDGNEIDRSLSLQTTVDTYEFRTTGSGAWWLEGHRVRDVVQRGTEGLPLSHLGVALDRPKEGDFLYLGPSVLHLGRRVGEFTRPDRAALHVIGLKTGLGRHWSIVTERGREGPTAEAADDEGANRAWRKSVSGQPEGIFITNPGDGYQPVAESQDPLHDYRDVARRHDLPKTHTLGGRPETLDWVERERPVTPDRVVDAIRGLASLASRRVRVPIPEVLAIMTPEHGERDADRGQVSEHQRASSYEVLRSWQEAGLVDILRPQEYGPPLVVARSPRIVALRRGPLTEAVLVGLCTPTVSERFRSRAGRFADVGYVRRTGLHTPVLVRVMTEDARALNDLAVELGHEGLMWVEPSPDSRLENAMTRTLDPEDPRFRVTGRFCYEEQQLQFLPAREQPPPTHVEIRHYANRPAMYVTIDSGTESLFTAFRVHAMLDLARASGVPAFSEEDGSLVSTGPVPQRLPLPVARLCVLLGGGVPGPRFVNYRLREYRYPFGERVLPMIRELVGPELISGRS